MRRIWFFIGSCLLILPVTSQANAVGQITRSDFVRTTIESSYTPQQINECTTTQLPFPDIQPTSRLAPFLCIAYRDEIIHGYPDGLFRPHRFISLYEAAKITALSADLLVHNGDVWYEGYMRALSEANLLHSDTSVPEHELSITTLLDHVSIEHRSPEISEQSQSSVSSLIVEKLAEPAASSHASSVSSLSAQASSSSIGAGISSQTLSKIQSRFDTLTDDIRIIPPVFARDIRIILNDPPKMQGNVQIFSKDTVHFFVWKRGDTIDRLVVLIEGALTPQPVAGMWEQLKGSTLEQTILTWVPPGGDVKGTPADVLPYPLSEVVEQHYGGSIDFAAGVHALSKLQLRGPLEQALSAVNFPTTNLQLLAGQALPELGAPTAANAALSARKKSESATDALKPTHFIELTRTGVWERPLDLQRTTLVDATVYLDEGLVFGFWGKGTFDSENIALFYKGPLKYSKDPADYLEAQVGFGAETMSLTQYLKFVSSYNARFPGAKYGFAGPTDTTRDTTLDAIFGALDALPLDLIKIQNTAIQGLSLAPGEPFPGPEVFNGIILGPLAEAKDGTKGPLVSVHGNALLFNETFGTFDFTIDTSGANGTGNGSLTVPLGSVGGQSLGNLGGDIALTIHAGPTVRSMQVHGRVDAGILGGRDIALNLQSDAIAFSSPANCSFPFMVQALLPIAATTDLTLSALTFNPDAVLPDPTALLECPEDIFLLIKNGVVYAFNGSVQLATLALDLLPENAVTKIGKEGLKFAGGAVTAGGEALLNAAASVPGAKEINEFGTQGINEAKKAAKAAAKKLAKEAERARKAAQEAANQAKKAINEGVKQFENFVSNPKGAIESIGGAIVGVGETVSGWFGGGGSSIPGFGWHGPYLPIKAIDVGGSHKLNPNTGRLMAWFVGEDGYPLELEDKNHWNLNFWYRKNGLPSDFPGFIRIDADAQGYAAAVDRNGRLWTYNGTWKLTDIYATDVGIGGGYIWITGTEPQWAGYKIYRAKYAVGRTKFTWQYMNGAGTRIDVGSDGRAWALNNNFEVWEWNNGWHNRHGQAIDLTVSAGNRVWVLSAADYNASHGGGRIFTFNRAGCTWVLGHCHPFPDNWEATQGFADTIGSGFGVFVWAVNNQNNIYLGTGRQ